MVDWSEHLDEKYLLDHYDELDINHLDENKSSFLLFCVKNSKEEDWFDLAKKLLKDPRLNWRLLNKANDFGEFPLFSACMFTRSSSSNEMVKLLLKEPMIDVNKLVGGKTTLYACALASQEWSTPETIKLLLSHRDIDVNFQYKGHTALMGAAVKSNTTSNNETVEILLNHPSIDPNITNNNGYTALMLACRKTKSTSTLESVKLILDHPSTDPNIVDTRGNTAFMICIFAVGDDLAKPETLDLFIENPRVDINIPNADNFPLTELIYMGDKMDNFVFKLLQRPDLNVNQQMDEGPTLLMLACESGRSNIIDKLLDLGANCNLYDNNGDLAINYLPKRVYGTPVFERLVQCTNLSRISNLGLFNIVNGLKSEHRQNVKNATLAFIDAHPNSYLGNLAIEMIVRNISGSLTEQERFEVINKLIQTATNVKYK